MASGTRCGVCIRSVHLDGFNCAFLGLGYDDDPLVMISWSCEEVVKDGVKMSFADFWES